MGKYLLKFLAVMALFVVIGASASHAQCTGGLIVNCPAAVNPQPGDLVWSWQFGQSPHTRGTTFQQVVNAGLHNQLQTKIQAQTATAAGAGFNLGVGIAPSPCTSGDVWTTSAGIFACINSNPQGPYLAAASTAAPAFANPAALPAVTSSNNGQLAFVQNCQNGNQSGGSATGCLYVVNDTGAWTAQPNPSSLTLTVGGQVLFLGGTTVNQGTGGKVQTANGTFTTGHALAYDATGAAVDSGTTAGGGGGGGSGTVTGSAQNSIPFYSSAGTSTVVSGLTIVNNAVLATNGSGVPAEVTTLPSSLTIPSPVISAANLTGTTNYATLTGSGKQTTAASTTAAAGFNLPPGVAPTSPANGDVWETSSGLLSRVAGVTQGPYVGNIVTTSPIGGGATGPTVTLTCGTCVTSTIGGALGGTAPITITSAGVISLGTQPRPITWIADSTFTVHNDTYNLYQAYPYTNPGTVLNFHYHTGGTSSPSFIASLQINGTPVTGCNAITVSSATDNVATCTGANTIATGQPLALVITGTTGTPSSANIQINTLVPAS